MLGHCAPGCFNCAPGEFDDDGNPLSPCVACPAGKTSQEEAATACTEVEKNLWEQFTELDIRRCRWSAVAERSRCSWL
eukprot:COSAG01_NODE_15051_length_1379_cov_3.289844_2_plen_78_part_00